MGGKAKPPGSPEWGGVPHPELGLVVMSNGGETIRLRVRTRLLIRVNRDLGFGLPSGSWSEVPGSSPAGGEDGAGVDGVLEVDLPPFFVPVVFFLGSEGLTDFAGLILSVSSRNYVQNTLQFVDTSFIMSLGVISLRLSR